MVVLCILVVELMERMTYYSVSGNLVLFCTNVLLYTSTQAVTLNLVFQGQWYTGTCVILHQCAAVYQHAGCHSQPSLPRSVVHWYMYYSGDYSGCH